ncbi:hypothetical protein [Methylorubrum extorquens]|uniref:hypothetical protein n=1 Tax=Methylorubrum extorquens TaxID=408 RepID=UPI0022385CC1|nr:hypothetical protein [Methylorubrum extorquens]UYW34480.1 hypothetical protein OKB92_10480 [Methylorubrum extorquens]
MPTITDPTILSSLMLTISLGTGFLALDARRDRHRAREVELQEAISLLKLHCDTLERLDDDDMPDDLLGLVVDLNIVLHDPDACRQTRALILDEDARAESRERNSTGVSADVEIEAFRELMGRRSDLAIAFMQCLVSGLLAFEKRWPECAGKIAPGLPRIIVSPVEEAHRVVQAAERFRSWSTPVTAAAA